MGTILRPAADRVGLGNRARMDHRMVGTCDGGPESEEVYDANVADELHHPADNGRKETIMRNVWRTIPWAKPGK